jgi:hypothetical protein
MGARSLPIRLSPSIPIGGGCIKIGKNCRSMIDVFVVEQCARHGLPAARKV